MKTPLRPTRHSLICLLLSAFQLFGISAFSVPVLFPLAQMFGGAQYAKQFTVTAQYPEVTDGTNIYVGTFATVMPSGGTNPIVNLEPNNYLLTFQDARTPLRFGVPVTNGVVNVLTLITNGLQVLTNWAVSGGGIGGSATNALAEGPGGIRDASLITNVQATAIVGTILTNNLPMSQLGGGGSGGTVAFDFNGTTNLITSDGSGNLAAQSFTDGTGASLGGGILDMTINMGQEGIWMSPGSGDGNMLQFYAPAITSNPYGYFLLGCIFFDSYASTDGRILGWENLGYTNTDGTYGGWFEQSCACSVDWTGRSNDGYWFTVPLNSFGQSLFGLLGNVMWPDANPYLIPPGIVDIFVPPGGYTNTAAIWMQPAQKSANPAAGILENDGTNYFICKTNSNGKLTVTPLMTRDDLTNGLSTFYGNASGLTNLSAAQLTGTVPLAALGNAITNQQSGVVLTNLLSYDGGQSWQYSASGYARIFTNATIPSSVAIGLGAVKASATLTGSNVVANGVIFGNGAGISNISNIAISQNLQISDLAGDSMSGGTITAINALIDGSGDSMSGGTIYAPTKFSTPGSYYGSGVTVVSGTVTNTIGNIVSFGGTFYGNLAGGTNLPAAGVTNAAGFWAAMPAPSLIYSNITATGTNAYSIANGVVVDDDRSLVATNDPRSLVLTNGGNFINGTFGGAISTSSNVTLTGSAAISIGSSVTTTFNNDVKSAGGANLFFQQLRDTTGTRILNMAYGTGVSLNTNLYVQGALAATSMTATNGLALNQPTASGFQWANIPAYSATVTNAWLGVWTNGVMSLIYSNTASSYVVVPWEGVNGLTDTNVGTGGYFIETNGTTAMSGNLSVGGTITGNGSGLTNLPWTRAFSFYNNGGFINTNSLVGSKFYCLNGTLSTVANSGPYIGIPMTPGYYGMARGNFNAGALAIAPTTNIVAVLYTNAWVGGSQAATAISLTWSGAISLFASQYQTNYAATVFIPEGVYGYWGITNNTNSNFSDYISISLDYHP